MKELLDLRGIITVLNTPFTEQDELDLPGLRRNVQAAIAAGVAGFLVPAMASEVGKLSMAERTCLVTTVLEETAGRVPVIGGASAAGSSQRLEAAANLIELGCQGILASLPFESEEQYECDATALSALNPGFLMLQDWDANGYGVPVPLVARLFDEIPAFRSLKIEVVPAGVKYSQVLAATGGRLHVCGGWAVMQMIEGLDRGVHAFMPTGMHEIYTRIDALYRCDSRPAAQALFNRLLPVIAFSNQHLDISIHFFKRLLYQQGIYATPRVRPPILTFDKTHQSIADNLITQVRQLTQDLDADFPLPARPGISI
jgi:dihydrodipicolinate synthase/N-acetylneuraminate lyase